MREAAAGVRVLASAAIGFSIYSILPVTAVAQTQPGHTIADKFSAEADRPAKEAAAKEAAAKKAAEAKQKAAAEKRRKEEQRKADESEMLATAKAEAEGRRVAIETARAEAEMAEKAAEDKANEDRRIIEDRRVEEARIATEQKMAAESKRVDDARKAAAEAKAAEERRVAETRRAEDARRLADARAAEARDAVAKAAADRKIADERRIADAKAAEDAGKAAEAKRAEAETHVKSQAMAAERDVEAQRVLERLKQAREQRENGDRRAVTAELPKHEPIMPHAPAGLGGPAPVRGSHGLLSGNLGVGAQHSSSNRVTVLLLMEPGNRGIRRHNKTADPLLCNGGGCFVSNGVETPATFLPGRRALGFRSTFGPRAGACANALGCVFRGIELGALPAAVQPIDMRVMRHDRREAQHITAPADCRATAGRLVCRRTIQSSNYVMWVVPEDVANQAGAAGLERALSDGLPDSEHAALPGHWSR